MRIFVLAGAVALSLNGGAVLSQSSGPDVRVQPGYFCSQSKCVRFSDDLQYVSIQGRRPVSVASIGLRSNPIISSEAYRQIFYLALRQSGTNGSR